VVTGSSFIANDLAWIKMHIQPDDDDVEIRDITLDLACLALWGPKARKVLAEVSADDVSNQAFPYLHSTTITIRGAEVLAQRVSYVGELGWELYVSPERAVQVWDALMAAGQAHEIEVGGYKALDSLRLEKGYRYYTADVTPLENPYEAGLGFCVKLNKGDFLGKEALLKAKEAGIDKKLCTLTLDGDGFIPIYGGEAITLENKVVSRVRSGGYGYTLKKNIILAYLPSELAKTGNRFQVEVFDERIGAEVTPVVLYDSKNEKIRA
jgi:4-methylaminobutanoate oxidase (formaldehyde-forming)